MVSLPIPDGCHLMSQATSRNVNFNGGDVLADLTSRRASERKYTSKSKVHLDPYLSRDSTKSPANWRPAFGQDGGAQTHLTKQQVGKDDLFLFFGWFRRVNRTDGIWKYVPGSPDLHVMFGWLQIAEVLKIDRGSDLDEGHLWLSDHPHWREREKIVARNNTIYVATDRLVVGGEDIGVPGGGTFDTFRDCLQLTTPQHARGRSDWQLPGWFHPAEDGKPALSHHGNRARWTCAAVDAPLTHLQSVSKGQEFVIDLEGPHKSHALSWLRSLFVSSSAR